MRDMKHDGAEKSSVSASAPLNPHDSRLGSGPPVRKCQTKKERENTQHTTQLNRLGLLLKEKKKKKEKDTSHNC